MYTLRYYDTPLTRERCQCNRKSLHLLYQIPKFVQKIKSLSGGYRRVKSTYVETYEQELFLKNFPKAIDERICRESPLLAKAIAAEYLLQVNNFIIG